jgi:hypothetical protein
MAGVIDESRKRTAIGHVKPHDDDFVIARAVWVHTEETVATGSDGAAVGVDVALSTPDTRLHWLKSRQCLGCCFR